MYEKGTYWFKGTYWSKVGHRYLVVQDRKGYLVVLGRPRVPSGPMYAKCTKWFKVGKVYIKPKIQFMQIVPSGLR